MEIQTSAHVLGIFWCRFDPCPLPLPGPGGPETLQAARHTFENSLQNKKMFCRLQINLGSAKYLS